MVAGITKSGKTHWIYSLLKNKDLMFKDTPPKRVLYCYGVYQSLYDKMMKEFPFVTFHYGTPTDSQIEDLSNEGHNVIILDDLLDQLCNNSDIASLFWKGAHHRQLTVISLVQNIYYPGTYARTISLNLHYLVLFTNPRDSLQIRRIGRQIFPSNGHLLAEAFEDCVKHPFGYIIVDLHPHSDRDYRLRSKIFPGEVTVIYQPL